MPFKVKSCLGTYRNHQLKRKLLFVLEDLVVSENTFISYGYIADVPKFYSNLHDFNAHKNNLSRSKGS